MQNKDGKRFTRKKGAMLILSVCLVGGAAFTTFLTMNRAEKAKEEQEKLVDLDGEFGQEEARQETKADAAVNAGVETDEAEIVNSAEAQADIAETEEVLANEMDVDPASLMDQEAAANEEETPAAEEASATIQPTVAYDDTSALTWPVAGTVVIDYSMDSTVYFPTLDQYKYNPALIIGAEVGNQVVASAKGIVEAIDVNEETGTTLTLNIGNNYELVYGQLKEVTVSVGETVETGQMLGYVSEPTKYYCEEGSNLYFEVKKDGASTDPFLYLE